MWPCPHLHPSLHLHPHLNPLANSRWLWLWTRPGPSLIFRLMAHTQSKLILFMFQGRGRSCSPPSVLWYGQWFRRHLNKFMHCFCLTVPSQMPQSSRTSSEMLSLQEHCSMYQGHQTFISDSWRTMSMPPKWLIWYVFLQVRYDMVDNFLQPCARIPLFWREVKDQCAGIVQIEFLTVPLKPGGQNIVHIIDRQLSHYHYTYPTSSQVSIIFLAGHGSLFIRAILSPCTQFVQSYIGTPRSLLWSRNCTSKGCISPLPTIVPSVSIHIV